MCCQNTTSQTLIQQAFTVFGPLLTTEQRVIYKRGAFDSRNQYTWIVHWEYK